jgi:hypothetical protein
MQNRIWHVTEYKNDKAAELTRYKRKPVMLHNADAIKMQTCNESM